jgi:hypothetical protein
MTNLAGTFLSFGRFGVALRNKPHTGFTGSWPCFGGAFCLGRRYGVSLRRPASRGASTFEALDERQTLPKTQPCPV